MPRKPESYPGVYICLLKEILWIDSTRSLREGYRLIGYDWLCCHNAKDVARSGRHAYSAQVRLQRGECEIQGKTGRVSGYPLHR